LKWAGDDAGHDDELAAALRRALKPRRIATVTHAFRRRRAWLPGGLGILGLGMDEWLTAARDRLASAAGEDPTSLELSQAEVDELLELARIAAHESGERINAPLLCYLVGLVQARGNGELADLVDAAVGKPA
jgi:hypothetical protein